MVSAAHGRRRAQSINRRINPAETRPPLETITDAQRRWIRVKCCPSWKPAVVVKGNPRGSDLWVPGTLRSSCDLLVLVNQPAEPVASLDVMDGDCGAFREVVAELLGRGCGVAGARCNGARTAEAQQLRAVG